MPDLSFITPSLLLNLGEKAIKVGTFGLKKIQKTPPEEILRIRKRWAEEMARHIQKADEYGNRGDAIIHDINRMDVYPDIDHKRGVSAWNSVEIKDVNNREIEFFAGMPFRVFEENGKWREANEYEDGEFAVPVIRVFYENIVDIEWNGDNYYNMPHFYLRYNRNHRPYHKLVYYTEHGDVGRRFFMEMEGFEPQGKKRSWF